MIKKQVILCLIFFALSLLFMSGICAVCNSNQIDINSASAEELDKIVNIGSARAGQIISLRPFESVEDLIKVNGIGEKTLSGIKEQGLACVDDEESEEQPEEKEEQEEEEEKEKESDEEDEEKDDNSENNEEDLQAANTKISEEITEKSTEINPIILNSLDAKTIKSEDNKGNLIEDLALYGIIAFSGVLGALLLLKKRKYKNEFR